VERADGDANVRQGHKFRQAQESTEVSDRDLARWTKFGEASRGGRDRRVGHSQHEQRGSVTRDKAHDRGEVPAGSELGSHSLGSQGGM
jgi:hypothetical protein